MNLNSRRANQIKSYIKTHSDSKQGEWPIEISGKIERAPYYKLPTNLLIYSIDNGRFAAEKLDLETQLGRVLDAENLDDVGEIKKLLLTIDPDATEKLKKDLLDKGQLHPGVITADGFVKNGNRRLAVIESIHEENPSAKWEYFLAIVLPETVSEKDLWRIEAGLQLSQDTKLDYGPINELLKLKEGLEAGLTSAQMANAMYGWDEDKVNEALERLKLINQYLIYHSKPKQYKRIERIHEYFIDTQKLIKNWRRSGVGNQDLNERIEMIFLFIGNSERPENRITHWDVRTMKAIFDSPKASRSFIDSISTRKHNRYFNRDTIDLAYQGFKDAVEITEIESETNQPAILLNKGIRLLEGIVESIDKNELFFSKDNLTLVEKLNQLMFKINKKVASNERKSTS